MGVIRQHLVGPNIDDHLPRLFGDAVAVMTANGAVAVDVVIPDFVETQTAAMVVLASEAFAYHRDGLARRRDDYGANTRLWLAFGAKVTSSDLVEAQRIKLHAQHVVLELLAEVDVLVMPTLASAFHAAEWRRRFRSLAPGDGLGTCRGVAGASAGAAGGRFSGSWVVGGHGAFGVSRTRCVVA